MFKDLYSPRTLCINKMSKVGVAFGSALSNRHMGQPCKCRVYSTGDRSGKNPVKHQWKNSGYQSTSWLHVVIIFSEPQRPKPNKVTDLQQTNPISEASVTSTFSGFKCPLSEMSIEIKGYEYISYQEQISHFKWEPPKKQFIHSWNKNSAKNN